MSLGRRDFDDTRVRKSAAAESATAPCSMPGPAQLGVQLPVVSDFVVTLPEPFTSSWTPGTLAVMVPAPLLPLR